MLLGRAKNVELQLEYRDGGWDVSGSSGSLGHFPEHATFSQSIDVLIQRAKHALPRSERPPSSTDGGGDSHRDASLGDLLGDPLISSLEDLESRWSLSASAGVRRLAARAYLSLCLQTLDGMEMADAIYGRALALQALASSEFRPEPAEMAVLAWLMGYPQEAESLARHLPARDPVREILTADGREAFSVARPGARWIRYLALLKLADVEREKEWLEWQSAHFADLGRSLPMLRAVRSMNRFENQAEWAQAVLQVASEGVREKTAAGDGIGADSVGAAKAPPANEVARFLQWVGEIAVAAHAQRTRLLSRFETDLGKHCAKADGGLWDTWTCEAYWRSGFFAGLDSLGRHYVDSLSYGPAAQGFLDYIADAPGHGAAAQFTRWYADLTAVRLGRPGSEKEFDDLREIPDLGGPAAERLYLVLDDFLQWKPRFGGEAVRRLAMQMDGRPTHRALLLRHLRLPLMDMRQVEGVCRSPAFRAGEISSLSFWCARFLGDSRSVRLFLARSDVPIAQRANAVYMLNDLESPAVTKARFRALLQESGFARAVTSPYLGYLDSIHTDLTEMEWVTRGWLTHHAAEKGSLTHAIYSARLAHTRSLRGHHDEGWRLIEPLLATGQGNIMMWGAKILDRLGRGEEAMALARRTVERYPDPDYNGDLAELLWKNGRYSEAAVALNPQQFRLQPGSWREIGARFRDAMVNKEDDEVLRALEALRAERIQTIYLHDFLERIGEKRPEVVFRACAQLERSGGLELIKARSFAYRYLKRTPGAQDPVEWLRENIPIGLREVGAQQFFQDREYDLLWDVVEVPGAELSSLTWLLRAGGSVIKPPTEPRQKALSARFSQARPGDLHHLLGRLLLGLEKDETIDRAASDPQGRSDACAVLAIRALARDQYEEASDWFQLSVLFSERNSELSNLSYAQLGRWYAETEPLSVLAVERRH